MIASGLRCDFQNTGIVAAGENVTFSAAFNSYVSIGADEVQIQVSKGDLFADADIVYDTSWLTITEIANGATCENIILDLSALSSYAGNSYSAYRWRIRFKDTNNLIYGWGYTIANGTPALFTISKRAWANPAATFRRRLTFNTDHPEIPAGYDYTASFNILPQWDLRRRRQLRGKHPKL
jgi:hypothetical protein